jgi:hypothetical protein
MKQGLKKDAVGNRRWYKDGELHREDGPAIDLIKGHLEWWLGGIQHREDGPAIVNNNLEVWVFDGREHRLDGPAVIHSDGTKEWYIRGKKVYSREINNLHKYKNLSEKFKQSIIKYELTQG